MNSGKSDTPRVPPKLVATVLTSVSVGWTSLLVIVQVAEPPSGTKILLQSPPAPLL